MINAYNNRRPWHDRAMHYFRRFWMIYLLLLPGLAMTILFCYVPMYGVQVAFKEYSVRYGIWGSEWVGLKHFIRFINLPDFWKLIRNTLLINIYSIFWGTPVPIILALMLNEVSSIKYKKTIQLVTYSPHFISTVAVVGLVTLFLKRETGLINLLLSFLGQPGKEFMSDPGAFRTIYIISDIWTGAGFGTIIYLAALSCVDMEVIEATIIDGATRLQKIWYINIPTILPTIIILLILSTGAMLNIGFEKVFLMQNALNLDTADVISTYTYRVGILGGQFSYTAAIGLFNSMINAVILLLVNAVIQRMTKTGLW